MCTEYVNSRRLMLELLRERNSLIVQVFFLIEAGYLYPASCLQHAPGLPVCASY